MWQLYFRVTRKHFIPSLIPAEIDFHFLSSSNRGKVLFLAEQKCPGDAWLKLFATCAALGSLDWKFLLGCEDQVQFLSHSQ